jgi:hypothetical protein
MSIFLMSFGLMLPAGAIVLGWLADAVGVPAATFVGAAVALVSAAVLAIARVGARDAVAPPTPAVGVIALVGDNPPA